MDNIDWISISDKGKQTCTQRQSSLLGVFYFLPSEIVSKAGDFIDMPRNPKTAMSSKKWRDASESDLFMLLICDGLAFLVWPYFGIPASMESFSGYDPLWRLAHNTGTWVQALMDHEIVPPLRQLFGISDNRVYGFNTFEDASILMGHAVRQTIQKYNWQPWINAVCEARCIEDFDYRNSRAKIDFYRSWYHSRAKHKTVSLEHLQDKSEGVLDIPDAIHDYARDACEKADVDAFKSKLMPGDLKLLQLRLEGYTQQEIADILGYKTHSAVTKRIRKLVNRYEDFRDERVGQRAYYSI